MRVLVTTSTFPVRLGDGVPRFVYDLAQSLRAHASVSVLAPDAPGALLVEDMNGLRVERFSYFRPRRFQKLALGEGMRDNLRRSWLARFQVPLLIWRQAATIRRMARREKVGIVNAHWMVPGGLAAAWARGRAGRFKLALHVHAGDVYLLARVPFGKAMAKWILGRTDAVFADGSHVRDSLIRLTGYQGEITLRPMGGDLATFGRASGGAVEESAPPGVDGFPGGFLLFFGRLSEKKGAIYLIQALPEVLKHHPGLGLILVGDGPEKPLLEEEVGRLGLGASVRFLGRQPHEEIVRCLHRCRLAVVPSIIDRHGETEGMPTVVLEAMAAGVRVVGSAVDGIPDIIRDGVNGWLCEPANPQDLARTISLALDDPVPSGVLEQAMATAAENEWRRVAVEYSDRLKRVLGSGS